jgi:hypothetical protein
VNSRFCILHSSPTGPRVGARATRSLHACSRRTSRRSGNLLAADSLDNQVMATFRKEEEDHHTLRIDHSSIWEIHIKCPECRKMEWPQLMKSCFHKEYALTFEDHPLHHREDDNR